MTATPKTTRTFALHANVFNLLVEKQAGSLGKAVLELVMNAKDASSPTIDVRLTTTRVEVADHGHGFQNDDEIHRFFSTLGTPHEAGDAHYGQFRMGRAQSWRFGLSTWRSNSFEMIADVKHWGRRHIVRRDLDIREGCLASIDLYDPLAAQELRDLETTLAEWVRWAPVPVTINGVLCSTNPATISDWTIADDDCFARLDNSPELAIYNRGIFVMALSATALGAGGCIISIPRLDLVYSRNAVKRGCPIWRSIQRKVRKNTMSVAQTKGMNDEQRSHFRDRLSSGDLTAADAI